MRKKNYLKVCQRYYIKLVFFKNKDTHICTCSGTYYIYADTIVVDS